MGNPQLENGFMRISTELWDALVSIRISGEARQIFDFIIRKTYGWNKKEDHISFSQIELATGISRRNSIRAVNKLVKMNLISVKKDTTTGNIYSINKKYSMWIASVKKDTCQKVSRGSVNIDTQLVSKVTHTIDTNNRHYTKDKGVVIPPNKKDVEAYCLERKNRVNAGQFMDFYESKGWVIGKNKMKSWKAAIRTWEQRDGRGPQKTDEAHQAYLDKFK